MTEIDAAEDDDLDAGEIRLDGNFARGDVGLHGLLRGGLGRLRRDAPKREEDGGEVEPASHQEPANKGTML